MRLAESRVDKVVDDGDEDDQSDGVQVVKQIVGDTVELHDSRHGSQVVGHLVVCEPVQRKPEEDLTSVETTLDLVNPDVVNAVHPGRGSTAENTGLHTSPEVVTLQVSVGLGGVYRKAALTRKLEKREGLGGDGASGRAQTVELFAPEENKRSEEEKESREGEGKPESDVLLNVDHADTARERAKVDHHVEVQEDAGDCHLRVLDDTLAVLDGDDLGALLPDLLSKKGRDVRLETTNTDAEDDETDGKATHGAFGVVHDGRDRGNNEQSVTDDGEQDRPLDGGVTSKVSVGNVTTEKRHQVSPELVETNETGGSLLALTKTTCLRASSLAGGIETRLGHVLSSSPGSIRTRLLDEVDENGRRSVVRETLAEFDERNSHCLPADGTADAAKGLELFLSRFNAINAIVLLLDDATVLSGIGGSENALLVRGADNAGSPGLREGGEVCVHGLHLGGEVLRRQPRVVGQMAELEKVDKAVASNGAQCQDI